MRIRIGLCLLACCCAVLAACTAAAPKGPNANATVPAVGKPSTPVSAQAALSSEAFTPYADIGASASDGLALGDTYAALHTACMNAADYSQYAASAPFSFRANRGLGFPQPWGPWGYLEMSLALQYGFNTPPTGGPDEFGGAPATLSSMPAGAQAAADKCFNIVMAFNDAQFVTSLAGIETMNNEISNDVVADTDFKKAGTAWSACMARNGYTAPDADAFAQNELTAIGLRSVTPGQPPGPPTAAQNRTQIAMAVTDAQCTQASDLAGIYFAVQASYEQQFVTANQQALNVAVRQYKAAFAKELNKLPALLRTISATLNLPHGAREHGGPGHPSKPSGTPSPSAG
jgi:hypothetical protein